MTDEVIESEKERQRIGIKELARQANQKFLEK